MASINSTPSIPKAWAAAQTSLGLVKHAASSTKAAGNKHFKTRMFGTALFHYHSAAFSIHGTGACMLIDVASPAVLSSVQDAEAALLLTELKNVLNNAAVCLLKLNNSDKAAACCQAVLQWLDPDDRKAAYRLVLATQPTDAPVPEVSDATIHRGQALAQERRNSSSCHDAVQGLLRLCKDVWVAARPAEAKAAQEQHAATPPPSALKAAVPTATPTPPQVDAASSLLLAQLQNAPPLGPLAPEKYVVQATVASTTDATNTPTRIHRSMQNTKPMPISADIPCSDLEQDAFSAHGGIAAAKRQFKGAGSANAGIQEAWHMVWLFPSPDAACSFVAEVARSASTRAAGDSTPLLEALPPAGAQLAEGCANELIPWACGGLPQASAAVLAAGVHSGNAAGLPQAALANMPQQLARACGAEEWYAPGVAFLCSAGCAVHKVWTGGVRCGEAGDATTALVALREHAESVLVPLVAKREAAERST